MTDARWLWVIAGPNGAGKSTLAAAHFGHLPVINPDVEALRLAPDRPADVRTAAGRASFAGTRTRLAASESFAVETTLSGVGHLRLMRSARAVGWSIGLAYVGIGSPTDAYARVAERYRRGGHYVPIEDVRRRYRRSMGHLRRAVGLADVASVFDNSSVEGHRMVLEVRAGVASNIDLPTPAWLRAAFAPQSIALGERLVQNSDTTA